MNSNEEINNKKMDDWIEIIYLQLYKDTHLIFMQAYEPLQGILNYFKNYEIDKMYIKNLKLLIISKVKILLKSLS